MLNSIFPFLVLPAVDAVGPGDNTAPTPVAAAFEGFVTGPPSALTLWIDDAISMIQVWGY